MSNAIRKLSELGQSIWCDNLGRGMIDSGELEGLIDLGIVGVTSNPTIFMKAITGGSDYDVLFHRLLGQGLATHSIYEGLVLPDIMDAADLLKGVFDRTGGVDGYVSLEVNPKLAHDTEATIEEARRLFASLNRPNVLIKVPATEEGIPAIETLIAAGISVNVTLIFSGSMYEKVMQAHLSGLRRFVAGGGDPSRVASVASFFVSRLDTLVDRLLGESSAPPAKVNDLKGKAGIANARLAYARFEQVYGPSGEFAELAARGARVQRPLWASTGTKNPNDPPTKYVDALVGENTVNTLPPHTIDATLQGGTARLAVRDDLAAARALFEQLEGLNIHMDAVTDQLLNEGVDIFSHSFDELLERLTQKKDQLRAAG